MIGQLGGGAAGASGGVQTGGLGGLLGQLTGGGTKTGSLGGLLGQLTGGAGGAPDALGGLGGLLAGLAGARGGSAATGLEDLINADNPQDEPDEEQVARLMLRAMTQAARADGDIDPDEKARIVDILRQSDPEDVEVIEAMLREPVNPSALAAETPSGLETQVYTMSVNAITPDNRAEAEYLHKLAEGLGIQPEVANRIHDGLGVPRLYR
jgi:uncharacterized membrane protein YebE (DUF533 family)